VTSCPGDAGSAKHAARTLLGYALECRLAGPAAPEGMLVPSAWDAWWACYRAGLPLSQLAPGTRTASPACGSCGELALQLAEASPPRHPGTGDEACGCLLSWAKVMRSPAAAVQWPATALSLALLKPGAPAGLITSRLRQAYEVLGESGQTLTAAATRRLYPEAYGADFVGQRDAYLTSAPVRILILRARRPGTRANAVKEQVRADTGKDKLRNHLHMPDNPGESFADIAQFAGYPQLRGLFEEHERDGSTERLAFYRAALGVG